MILSYAMHNGLGDGQTGRCDENTLNAINHALFSTPLPDMGPITNRRPVRPQKTSNGVGHGERPTFVSPEIMSPP